MSAIKMLAPSGQIEAVEAVSATTVKNTFAEVLDTAVERGILAVTRHNKARAVLLSIREYEALVKRAGDPLERMHDYFDEIVVKMQGPGTEKAVEELFGAMPGLSGSSPRSAARRR